MHGASSLRCYQDVAHVNGSPQAFPDKDWQEALLRKEAGDHF